VLAECIYFKCPATRTLISSKIHDGFLLDQVGFHKLVHQRNLFRYFHAGHHDRAFDSGQYSFTKSWLVRSIGMKLCWLKYTAWALINGPY
jgi:hypothetical protein